MEINNSKINHSGISATKSLYPYNIRVKEVKTFYIYKTNKNKVLPQIKHLLYTVYRITIINPVSSVNERYTVESLKYYKMYKDRNAALLLY